MADAVAYYHAGLSENRRLETVLNQVSTFCENVLELKSVSSLWDSKFVSVA